MLSQNQLDHVCLLGQGTACCLYLDQDPNDYQKFYCLKLRKADKQMMDDKVKDFLDNCKRIKLDPYKQNNIPFGDNCSGYPYLLNILQGYDVP